MLAAGPEARNRPTQLDEAAPGQKSLGYPTARAKKLAMSLRVWLGRRMVPRVLVSGLWIKWEHGAAHLAPIP